MPATVSELENIVRNNRRSKQLSKKIHMRFQVMRFYVYERLYIRPRTVDTPLREYIQAYTAHIERPREESTSPSLFVTRPNGLIKQSLSLYMHALSRAASLEVLIKKAPHSLSLVPTRARASFSLHKSAPACMSAAAA